MNRSKVNKKRIYVTHSTGFDYRSELYSVLRNSALNEKYDLILPHEKGEKVANSKKVIASSNLVIAEVSHPSTGQGIELGWADSADVPILCIYMFGKNVSQSLRTITNRFISYKTDRDMLEKVSKAVNSILNR
jgi:hypothetical protein